MLSDTRKYHMMLQKLKTVSVGAMTGEKRKRWINDNGETKKICHLLVPRVAIVYGQQLKTVTKKD